MGPKLLLHPSAWSVRSKASSQDNTVPPDSSKSRQIAPPLEALACWPASERLIEMVYNQLLLLFNKYRTRFLTLA